MLQTLFSKFAFYSYWGMALVATVVVAVIVAMVSKSVHRKFYGVLAGVLVMLGFITPIALRINADKQVVEAKQDRYATAKAIFDERCKSAGEKIYKTVDNVEGVTLLKVRKNGTPTAEYNPWDDPMWVDAALTRDYKGSDYIFSFLGWSEKDGYAVVPYYPKNSSFTILTGYKYVDVFDSNGKHTRSRLKPNAKDNPLDMLSSEFINTPSRYAIDYVNYIDPNDRKYWVAGTKVIIKDTQTNELLAEKTWYTLERGQGSHAGQREPWLAGAVSCPTDGQGNMPTREFVKKVLKTTQP